VAFALARPRDDLHRRINMRVIAMFDAGLAAEVERLRNGPRPPHPVPMLAAAVERTQARTRQLAKRQETWFRGLAEVRSLPVAPDEPAAATADRLLAI